MENSSSPWKIAMNQYIFYSSIRPKNLRKKFLRKANGMEFGSCAIFLRFCPLSHGAYWNYSMCTSFIVTEGNSNANWLGCTSTPSLSFETCFVSMIRVQFSEGSIMQASLTACSVHIERHCRSKWKPFPDIISPVKIYYKISQYKQNISFLVHSAISIQIWVS